MSKLDSGISNSVASAASPISTATSSSMCSPSRRPQQVLHKIPPHCGKRLRSDLLHKLGIRAPQKPLSQVRTSLSFQSKQATILGTATSRITKAPLKGKEDGTPVRSVLEGGVLGAFGSVFRSPRESSCSSTDSYQSCSSSSPPSSTRKTQYDRRRLTFDEEVSIVSIPRREQYSNRIKHYLWHKNEDVQASIMRNTIEYAADGWKWEEVREEGEHIYCEGSGEWIHPVHREIARLIRRQQGLPDGAPVTTPFFRQTSI